MTLPDWLLHHLADQNPDGVSRGARLTRCPRCHTRTLTGLDADRCALAATVDPTALDHLGEYLALATGLRTYTLARRTNASGNPRWEIDERTRWAIAHKERRYPVLPQHRCGTHLPANGSAAFVRPTTHVATEHPPF
jgi:hypothetical protein